MRKLMSISDLCLYSLGTLRGAETNAYVNIERVRDAAFRAN